MDSLPSKMDEADRHLDRLGGILRSLRAPPPDRSITSSAAGRIRPIRQRHQRHQLRDWRQLQLQQQDGEQEEGRPVWASGSSRSRTVSRSSQTAETPHVAPPPTHASRREQEAGTRPVYEGAFATPRQHQSLGDDDEDSCVASTVRCPSAPSSTVPPVVLPEDAEAETDRRGGGGGGGGGGNESTAATNEGPLPPSPVLRERVVRTWWRGLSCGVCFAAGAWAREGHGVYGAVLALAAVFGETIMSHLA